MVEARPAPASVADEVRHFSVGIRWVLDGELRLDASHYSQDGLRAQRLVEASPLSSEPVVKLATEVFAAPISRRYFSAHGVPYLTPSEVYHFRYEATRHVVKRLLREPDRWMVDPGWILLTQSGSVGRITLSTERLRKYVVSQNLIRIVPSDKMEVGYLYAFLASWIGQALLTRDQFGAAIKHLQPHHVGAVEVPVAPKHVQTDVDAAIRDAYAKRDRANELLDEADALLHKRLELPRFDESSVDYFELPDEQIGELPRGFSVSSANLQRRLDASFHVPIVRSVRRRLNAARYDPVELARLSSRTFIPPRFKRIYVDSEHGVPLLQGSHLPQLEPRDLKYISRSKTAGLDKWILQPGWVLVTCSGTIGRVSMSTKYQDGWAASQHILRVVADKERAHAGYVAAFLMCPYGNHQLTSKVYGGVVDELTAEDTDKVLIPNAPLRVQRAIGELVTEAFDLKDEATALEHDAIAEVEALLEQPESRFETEGDRDDALSLFPLTPEDALRDFTQVPKEAVAERERKEREDEEKDE